LPAPLCRNMHGEGSRHTICKSRRPSHGSQLTTSPWLHDRCPTVRNNQNNKRRVSGSSPAERS
jgi:hypothetical protein